MGGLRSVWFQSIIYDLLTLEHHTLVMNMAIAAMNKAAPNTRPKQAARAKNQNKSGSDDPVRRSRKDGVIPKDRLTFCDGEGPRGGAAYCWILLVDCSCFPQ